MVISDSKETGNWRAANPIDQGHRLSYSPLCKPLCAPLCASEMGRFKLRKRSAAPNVSCQNAIVIAATNLLRFHTSNSWPPPLKSHGSLSPPLFQVRSSNEFLGCTNPLRILNPNADTAQKSRQNQQELWGKDDDPSARREGSLADFPVTDGLQQRSDGTPTGRTQPTPPELRLIVPPSCGTGGGETTCF
jgi:hypothetical protein